MAIRAMIEAFESLGGDGEFAMAQRMLGVERPGLFGLASAPLQGLLATLERDFAGLAAPAGLDLTVAPDDEFHVRVREYGFVFPTQQFLGLVTAEALRARQAALLDGLVDRLRGDLARAERVFIRKAGPGETDADALALHRALRRHGPVTLLWVARDEQMTRIGAVEVLRDGLLRGHVNRFAPDGDPANVSTSWLDICRHAYALWRAACPPGTQIVRGGGGVRNLLRGSDGFAGPGWRAPADASAAIAPRVAGPRAGAAVMELTLPPGDGSGGFRTAQSHYLPEGVAEADVHVGSLQLWLARDFAGGQVDLVFDGYPTLRMRNADMSRRETWQRIWVACVIPAGHADAHLALQARGGGGRLRTSCWQLERGGFPTGYVPGEA